MIARPGLALSALPLILSACSVFQSPPADPLRDISRLSPGMEKSTVRAILGDPAKTEFNPRQDAWHYCRSGKTANEFAVVLFADGKVTAARHYNVTVTDPDKPLEACERYIKPQLFPEKR